MIIIITPFGALHSFKAFSPFTTSSLSIFYGSKFPKTLGRFVEYFGADRQVSVSRELTKMFEETVRGTAT